MKKYLNDVIIIGYICVFLGIFGSIGSVDLDRIGLGQALLQIMICMILEFILFKLQGLLDHSKN